MMGDLADLARKLFGNCFMKTVRYPRQIFTREKRMNERRGVLRKKKELGGGADLRRKTEERICMIREHFEERTEEWEKGREWRWEWQAAGRTKKETNKKGRVPCRRESEMW